MTEHSLEFTSIFNDFQDLVESKLSTFVEKRSSNIRDFYSECRDSLDGKFTVLFEEHEHKWFVDMLLDWLDYAHFHEGMVAAAKLSMRSDCSSRK